MIGVSYSCPNPTFFFSFFFFSNYNYLLNPREHVRQTGDRSRLVVLIALLKPQHPLNKRTRGMRRAKAIEKTERGACSTRMRGARRSRREDGINIKKKEIEYNHRTTSRPSHLIQ